MTAELHRLPATPATVHWGFFDRARPPAVTVSSGDLVEVEAITHQAGDAPDLLMDEGIERVFAEVQDRGPGPHLLTGPIAVTGARPGDVLQVDILDAAPRLPYGVNLAAPWGLLREDLPQARITVFSLDHDVGWGRAAFAFDWTAAPGLEAIGEIITPGAVTREPALDGVLIPLRPHFGTMGVAPAAPGRHSSIPPGRHGGNIDNWRIGRGGRMLYPVQAPGALLSVGDPHVSQGDGEISGTALEASLGGLLRLTLRRDIELDTPVLETGSELLVHGFGDDLDDAMLSASRSTLDVLEARYGLSRPDAYAFSSLAVDFTVTQVVDGRRGVHARIPKSSFPGWAGG